MPQLQYVKNPPFSTRWILLLAPAGVYAIATFEMFFMGGPFAVYFYTVYSPFLTWTQSSSYLIWLSDFFMPHLATPQWWLLRFVTRVPRYLLHFGLASFAIHAGYLYWMKFLRKDIATRLLYRYVRHPQYSSLAIVGAGLVFYWPRFINLVLLFLMFFGYYMLAKNEEARMEKDHPGAYGIYKKYTSMFFPGGCTARGAGRVFSRAPGGSSAACLALLGLSSALVGSFLLRAVSVHALDYEVLTEGPGCLVVFLQNPADPQRDKMEARVAELSKTTEAKPGSVHVFYVLQDLDLLQHLLVDSGVKQKPDTDVLSEGAWYLIHASASYPGGRSMTVPTEAFRMTALRQLEQVYSVAKESQSGDLVAVELPQHGFLHHAMMPIL